MNGNRYPWQANLHSVYGYALDSPENIWGVGAGMQATVDAGTGQLPEWGIAAISGSGTTLQADAVVTSRASTPALALSIRDIPGGHAVGRPRKAPGPLSLNIADLEQVTRTPSP